MIKLSVTRLELLSFIIGAAVLTFELTAARIVAPYLGNTIYIWTSIIGVILAALALGYYRGGIWADKRQERSDIIVFLLLAAVLIALTNIFKDSILTNIVEQDFPLQLQAFLASLYLFAAPTFLLGAATPYLARLSISSVATSGRHVSRIDAAGTIGSLVGTFATGYFLFGLIGSRNLLTFLALSLILATFLLYTRRYVYWQIAALVIVGLTGFAANPPRLSGLVADIDTAYGRYIVRNVGYERGTVRVLQTATDSYQSGVYVDDSNAQPFAYIRAFDYASNLKPQATSYAVIGGGAFTFPEDLARKQPNAVIDTVEIDSKLTEISKQYFNFKQPKNLNIITNDGRAFLNTTKNRYDMLFLDAFGGSTPPFQLLTREATERLYSALKSDGIAVANIISASGGEEGDMIQHVYSTYNAVFPFVRVIPVQTSLPGVVQNLQLIASKQPLDEAMLLTIATNHPEYNDMLIAQLPLSFSRNTVLTDDYAPVEQLAH